MNRYDPNTGALIPDPSPVPRFDPMTGQPIAAPSPAPRFDAFTGLPLSSAVSSAPLPRFDPMTGQPIAAPKPAPTGVIGADIQRLFDRLNAIEDAIGAGVDAFSPSSAPVVQSVKNATGFFENLFGRLAGIEHALTGSKKGPATVAEATPSPTVVPSAPALLPVDLGPVTTINAPTL